MDILNITITSLADLAKLSIRSRQCLYTYVLDRNKLADFRLQYAAYFNTVWHENDVKLYIIVHSLNADQAHVFFSIFDKLRTHRSLSCIDACPGTGKTFLIACILMAYVNSATYMVYTNKLSELMNAVYFDGVSLTCCKFLMNLLGYNYLKVKYLWSMRNLTLEGKCQELEELAKTHKPVHPLYILDEDSVVSPFFIYFLYCLYRYHNVHIIFIGDKHQQLPINATKYHLNTNYSLLTVITTPYELNTNVRQQTDVHFVSILNDFLSCIRLNVSPLMTFNIKAFLYDRLSCKFNTDEDFTAMFFSPYHIRLKQRLLRYEAYMERKGVTFCRMYIHAKVGRTLEPVLDNIKKFRPYIVLVENCQYVYHPNNYTSYMVRLLEVRKNTLKIYNETLKRELIIGRSPVSPSFIPEELIGTMQELGYKSLHQYPLKELTSTYHAAQGLTITNQKIELDLDTKNVKGFYVGLTRITQLNQLVKIHTSDLLNLAYTKKQKDKYYYKIITYPKQLNLLKFSNCDSVSVFEHGTRNLRIEQKQYEKLSNVTPGYTDLMNYIQSQQL